MPIPTDPAAATGLPSNAVPDVLPFRRRAISTLPDRDPPRPSTSAGIAGALDELSEARAMVGLRSLAAEALPAPHASEFCVLLEVIHRKRSAALSTLSRSHGQPPFEPAEA